MVEEGPTSRDDKILEEINSRATGCGLFLWAAGYLGCTVVCIYGGIALTSMMVFGIAALTFPLYLTGFFASLPVFKALERRKKVTVESLIDYCLNPAGFDRDSFDVNFNKFIYYNDVGLTLNNSHRNTTLLKVLLSDACVVQNKSYYLLTLIEHVDILTNLCQKELMKDYRLFFVWVIVHHYDNNGTQALRKKFGDVNTLDYQGDTLLIGLVNDGSIDAVKVLLGQTVNGKPLVDNINYCINNSNSYNNGKSALTIALSANNPEMAKVLIDHGAALSVDEQANSSYMDRVTELSVGLWLENRGCSTAEATVVKTPELLTRYRTLYPVLQQPITSRTQSEALAVSQWASALELKVQEARAKRASP